MKSVFVRCMDGHYFSDATCPNDGWRGTVMPKVEEVLNRGDDNVSIETFRSAGLAEEEIAQVLIVESTDRPASLFRFL